MLMNWNSTYVILYIPILLIVKCKLQLYASFENHIVAANIKDHYQRILLIVIIKQSIIFEYKSNVDQFIVIDNDQLRFKY